jgi:cytoskeleton-associated protein 5
MGESKETMRVKIRSLMRRICRLYPASKLFLYVMKGLESKNARTRSECLDALATLIQRNGMTVCSPSKVFPSIATQVGDRDATVRNAALGVIVQAYMLIGDNVYKYFGRINDKDKSLIDEKIRRLPSENNKLPVTESLPPKETLKPAQNSAQLKTKSASVSLDNTVTPLEVKKEFSLDLEAFESSQVSASRPIGGLVGGFVHNDPMTGTYQSRSYINLLDPMSSLGALKKLEETLSANADGYRMESDMLILDLASDMHTIFTSAEVYTSNGARLAKHVVNALILVFSSESLAKGLSKEPLRACISEVLDRLLDSSLPSFDQGSQLSKMLNILMVRILQNCNGNLLFRLVFSFSGVTLM